jgi:DNA repair protein RadC
MTKEHHHQSQMSFLSPEDAELLHRGRLALAEFVTLYEARRVKQLERAPQIKSPQDVYEFVRFEMEDLEQEQMRVINLTTKNRIISAPMIYQGSLHTTVVRVAEIFRPAIIENANGIVVVHNHPSGDCDPPSPEDVALTREIVRAGKLLDIETLDHLIIGRGDRGFVSLKERGLGFDR